MYSRRFRSPPLAWDSDRAACYQWCAARRDDLHTDSPERMVILFVANSPGAIKGVCTQFVAETRMPPALSALLQQVAQTRRVASAQMGEAAWRSALDNFLTELDDAIAPYDAVAKVFALKTEPNETVTDFKKREGAPGQHPRRAFSNSPSPRTERTAVRDAKASGITLDTLHDAFLGARQVEIQHNIRKPPAKRRFDSAPSAAQASPNGSTPQAKKKGPAPRYNQGNSAYELANALRPRDRTPEQREIVRTTRANKGSCLYCGSSSHAKDA